MESLCKVVLGAQQKAPNLNALNALNATFKSTFCLSKWFLGQYLCKRPQKSVSCYWQICSGSIFKVLSLKIFLWGILIVHDDDDRADDEIEEASAEHLTKGSIRVMEWGKCIVSWWILHQHHLVRYWFSYTSILVRYWFLCESWYWYSSCGISNERTCTLTVTNENKVWEMIISH